MKFAELRLTAFGKSSGPTTSFVKLCRTGPSIAVDTPNANAKRNTCHSATTPAITKIPSTAEERPPAIFVAMRTLLLLKRSASAPPCKLNRSTGANCNAVTKPKYVPLCVSSSTSQSWAMRWAHEPILETAFAGKRIW
ncbi:unannotated protein [freshwater metagenome]|uniref:Unannotated protein n=1 Tax=freshwater metagenome TaxID=449393 RepID=A0A6J7PBN9_9ZZZZ